MDRLVIGGVEVKVRKGKTEHFGSALLSLCTGLSKQGIEVTDVVARPFRGHEFYEIEYLAFSGNKQVSESSFAMQSDDDEFFKYLMSEQKVNDDYSLNARFIPLAGHEDYLKKF